VHAYKELSFVRLAGTRIVSKKDVIDRTMVNVVPLGNESICLRFAPDECFVMPVLTAAQTDAILSDDPHAILLNEGAFSGAWVDETHALDLLARLAEWEMPSDRPAFVQGAVAGIATKLWFDDALVLFVVQTPYAHELADRLR